MTAPAPSTSFPLLAQILAQNAQWSEDVNAIDPTFFPESAKGQHPKILWIGCSDSRAPANVLLGCKPGEVFVTRNIANQVHPNDDSALAVLTYAIFELGIQHIIVAGHTSCGGVAAAYSMSPSPPEPTTPLARWLLPLIHLCRSSNLAHQPKETAIPQLLEASVRQQVRHVVHCEPMQKAWKEGKEVWVHGWVYQVEKGLVRDLECSVGAEGKKE